MQRILQQMDSGVRRICLIAGIIATAVANVHLSCVWGRIEDLSLLMPGLSLYDPISNSVSMSSYLLSGSSLSHKCTCPCQLATLRSIPKLLIQLREGPR